MSGSRRRRPETLFELHTLLEVDEQLLIIYFSYVKQIRTHKHSKWECVLQKINDNCKAIVWLCSLLTYDLLSDLVERNNEYAAMKRAITAPLCKRSLFRNWKNITDG